MHNLLESASFGNILNIAGILFTLIGFAITIHNSRQTRTAAQAAKGEVQKMRQDLHRVNTVADFTQAIWLIEEIKRLHREDRWNILPERYASLRSLIISIRSTYSNFTDDQKIILQSTLTQVSNMDKQVERFLAVKKEPPDISKLNNALTRHSDNLREILVYIRNDIGV